MIKKISYVLILVLICVVIGQYIYYNNKLQKYIIVENKTDVKYIPINNIDTVYQTKIDMQKYLDTIIQYKIDTIYIDTIAILNDYYAKCVYNDSINFSDSLGYVIINDTITQNKIVFRNVLPRLNQKIVQNTITIEKAPKNTFYLGLNTGYIQGLNEMTCGLNLYWNNKNIALYGASFNVLLHNNTSSYNYMIMFNCSIPLN